MLKRNILSVYCSMDLMHCMERKISYRVDVGEGVLGLAVLSQDARGDLVDLADQLEHGVIRQLAKSELALGDVAGIGLTEDGVTVSRDDLARVQGRPQVVLDGLVAKVVANGGLHLGEPVKHLLVGPVEYRLVVAVIKVGEMCLTIRGEDQPIHSNPQQGKAWGSSEHYQQGEWCGR